jgi:hypothetical protein
MLYAFARDHGVFGSRFWKKVNPVTGTPVRHGVQLLGPGSVVLSRCLLPVVDCVRVFHPWHAVW